jgi:hypothetical protein
LVLVFFLIHSFSLIILRLSLLSHKSASPIPFYAFLPPAAFYLRLPLLTIPLLLTVTLSPHFSFHRAQEMQADFFKLLLSFRVLIFLVVALDVHTWR